MMVLRRLGFVLGAAASVAACSKSSGSSVHLPSFADVTAAPPAIQTAARAVVRISTVDEYATGSFISPTGLLLTNNHVLGVGICPVEGCAAQLTFMFQRGALPQSPQSVFVVPVSVDIGLDMAVVQVYEAQGGAQLSTPDYLTLNSLDPSMLQGKHVNVVGHPEGDLKKWTEGQVIDANGTWIQTDAYILPGNSGSPILDDDGKIVGLIHRGPSDQDLVTTDGIDEYSIGSASSALVQAMSAPLPAATISVVAPTTADNVTANDLVWLNGQTKNANIGGLSTPVIAVLASACDAGLARNDYASPNDLGAATQPCLDAEGWIECRSDASAGFAVCPSDVDTWRQRFQTLNAKWVAMNGQVQMSEVSFAISQLASTMAQGQSEGAASLTQALTSANTLLDFTVATYLAAFQVDSYQGTNILSYVRNYTKVPDYALQGSNIANAALWLNNNGALSGSDTNALLKALASDPNVDLGAKLYIEQVLYQSGAL